MEWGAGGFGAQHPPLEHCGMEVDPLGLEKPLLAEAGERVLFPNPNTDVGAEGLSSLTGLETTPHSIQVQ